MSNFPTQYPAYVTAKNGSRKVVFVREGDIIVWKRRPEDENEYTAKVIFIGGTSVQIRLEKLNGEDIPPRDVSILRGIVKAFREGKDLTELDND